ALRPLRAAHEDHGLAEGGKGSAQGRARVEARPGPRRAEAPAGPLARGPLQAFEEARGGGALRRGHRVEVGPAEDLGRARDDANDARSGRCHPAWDLTERDFDLPGVRLRWARAGQRRREASATEKRPKELE